MKCIDLFAGPGGLGEGFARGGFSIAISIEKETTECRTLLNRKVYNLLLSQGQRSKAASLGQADLGEAELAELYPKETRVAKQQVAQLELGAVPFKEVYQSIQSSLEEGNNEPLVLLGGPPCQAYSIVGRSRNIGKSKVTDNPDLLTEFYADARHTLYREYLKVLSVFEPDIFIMENVKGILSARTGPLAEKGSVVNNIIADLKNPGLALEEDKEFQRELSDLSIQLAKSNYVLVPLVENTKEDLLQELSDHTEPSDFLIRCEEHGVPQTRHRVIICGVREDVFAVKGKPKQLSRAKSPTTVEQVIKTFPKLRSNITRQEIAADAWSAAIKDEIEKLASIKQPNVQDAAPTEAKPTKAKVQGNKHLSGFLEDSSKGITGHKTRSHMISDLARYYFCADFAEREGRSPKIHDWPVGKLAPDHKDIQNKGNRLSTSGFSDRFKVQVWNRPASTITSHISKDGHYFIHPDKTQCRSLSVREAARIQTFPDSYHFCGGISKQFHQIGNAVPPYLAFQIAALIREYLTNGTLE